MASGAATFHKKFPVAKLLVIEKSGLSWQEFLKINPVELY